MGVRAIPAFVSFLAGCVALLVATGLHLVGAIRGRPSLKRWGVGLELMGAFLLAVAWGFDARQKGRWIPASPSDTAIILASLLVLLHPCLEGPFRKATEGRATGGLISLTALLVACGGLLVPWASGSLLPAQGSLWFKAHVVTTLLAYGALLVNGVEGVGGLAPLPGGRWPEGLGRRALALGFPLLSLGMSLEAWWSHLVWGSCWAWSPREVWMAIVWLLSLVQLRALQAGWPERRRAAIALAGFLAVLMAAWRWTDWGGMVP